MEYGLGRAYISFAQRQRYMNSSIYLPLACSTLFNKCSSNPRRKTGPKPRCLTNRIEKGLHSGWCIYSFGVRRIANRSHSPSDCLSNVFVCRHRPAPGFWIYFGFHNHILYVLLSAEYAIGIYCDVFAGIHMWW